MQASDQIHVTWPIVASALSAVLIILLSALATILWQKVNKLETRIDQLETDILTVKVNYLRRFDDLKDHINEKHLQIIEKITILTTMITPMGEAYNLLHKTKEK